MKIYEFCIGCGDPIAPSVLDPKKGYDALCVGCRYHGDKKPIKIQQKAYPIPDIPDGDASRFDGIDASDLEVLKADLAREAFRKLMEFIWKRGRGRQSKKRMVLAAFRRFAVASAAANVQLVDGLNYSELAGIIGIKKPRASDILREFDQAWGIHVRQRTGTAINNMRAARRRRR